MKTISKFALVLGVLFGTLAIDTFSQVSINTDGSLPDNSAMLDVRSTTKGLLLPRVALTSISSALPVTSPATGLQVYNTATAGLSPNNVTPGLYCWNGLQWVPVLAPRGTSAGDMQYWNGTQWVRIPVGTQGQVLTLNNSIPAWTNPGPMLPSVITDPIATFFTAVSAISGGNLSDGGSPVIARGVCWGTSPGPIATNPGTHSNDGRGTGLFSSSLTNLLPHTLYYVRAYATNSVGTNYGNELSFTTRDGVISLSTALVYGLTETSAFCDGNVTEDGGAPVTARGICWSKNPEPTIANSLTNEGSGIGQIHSTLTGLDANTTYYARAYATNIAGTYYGNQLTFTTFSFYIGQSFGGGIIFYLDVAQHHGLIAATTDQSTSAPWGCNETSISGTSTAMGTGQANTIAILNGCSQSGIAARICDDLVLNGFSDWFLPSKDELFQMYLQRNVIGGFQTESYWSSSEVSSTHAWYQNFIDGSQAPGNRFELGVNYHYVRAVRSF